MSIVGKTAAKAASVAADAVGDLVGDGLYPETEFGLAAFLFDRIAQSEKAGKDRDRAYYTQLMYECLRTVRAARSADS